MTLIIARIIDNKICIESDSKITGNAIVRNNPLESRLKSLILDQKLCLCYAGNIEFADLAYRYFIEQSKIGLDWNHYLQFLLKLNLESNNETDFILAGYNRNSPLLFEISNAKINQTKTSWIGSKKSFSKFQEYYHSEVENEIEPKTAMTNAFRKVLNNEISDAVGGFHFSIKSNDKDYSDSITGEIVTVFEYLQKAELYNGRDITINITEKGKSENIPSGDATTGSFAVAHFTPLPSQENCVGVHFGHGSFGIFYPPKNLTNRIIYTNVTATEFLSKVFDEFNIKLSGFELLPSTMGLKLIQGGPD